jgi:hypothetical protein
MLPNQPVIVAIKVIFVDHIRDPFPSAIIKKKAAQNGLLRFDGVWRNTQILKLWVGRIIHECIITLRP